MCVASLRTVCCIAITVVGVSGASVAAEEPSALARKAQAILKTHCYRCHGQDGAVEGGVNYVLDLPRLVARRKVVPGKSAESPLYARVAAGEMPPPDEEPRPSEADIALLKKWIDAGAPPPQAAPNRKPISEADVLAAILADVEGMDRRSRRFMRYFSLAHLYNAGLGDDELQTYRLALAKLLNSLSWHPRITLPKPIDPAQTVLRIDLRDFLWDANLWNRILADYPYGILRDTTVARAVAVATASKMPWVRADWFIATACRPPLYHDLLQLPVNLAELERQLRVDPAVNIQQERVARAGFTGSGVARNNRMIERHDALHGAYWRTYDFEAVRENLLERDTLLPDRRNLFAYPLGPGALENNFQHVGGEVIFNLPNGLHGYMIVNANNTRLDKAPTAIVSDPKRPDRAVENGISCMSCHYRGINPKTDQIRDYVQKNPKAFSPSDVELIKALYVPADRMKALMEEDAERFRQAVEKTGNRITPYEPVSTMTLRYEADVDLPTAAAEIGIPPQEFLQRLGSTDQLVRNLGAWKVPGGVVHRPVWVQAFADVVRDLRLGVAFQPAFIAQSLPDNTGELDPLEGVSGPVNDIALLPDGLRALFASGDKSIRLWDIDAGRDLRRFVGHTASVWCVAVSPDGRWALSGGADRTVRLWDIDTGRELYRFEGHTDLVSCVTFTPDGRRALSGGFDHRVIVWDLEKRRPLHIYDDLARYVTAVVPFSDGRRAAVAGGPWVRVVDLETGAELSKLDGHTAPVASVAISPDGQRLLTGSDDGSVRLWNVSGGKPLRTLAAHQGPVRSLAFAPDGRRAVSGGDAVVVWDLETGRELRRFLRHREPILRVAFASDTETLSGSRDASVLRWKLPAPEPTPPAPLTPPQPPPPPVVPSEPAVPAPTPDVPAPATMLRPAAVIPVGGTMPTLMLSPNGRWLFAHNATQGTIERVDADSLKRAGKFMLSAPADVVRLSPDGKALYALFPDPQGCRIDVIDPSALRLDRSFPLPFQGYDLAVRDDGTLWLTGGGHGWTDLVVADAASGTLRNRWGNVWSRTILRLTPQQDRLYLSSQGVSPGHIDGMVLPQSLEERPKAHRASARPEQPLGGDFVLTPDGRFLLCKSGTILQLAPRPEDDLRFVGRVEPFLAAAVDPERTRAFFLTADGSLRQHSYPDFRFQKVDRLGTVAYQAVYDPGRNRLYVAAFDPQSLTENPRQPGFGDIYVYDLKR
ncbi:MAG: c-type cytochrome domain-containing protein [Gemmataceae bacterium]|nr:c-type cytochrome domain-containing protein [Gemmataceae bacterium]